MTIGSFCSIQTSIIGRQKKCFKNINKKSINVAKAIFLLVLLLCTFTTVTSYGMTYFLCSKNDILDFSTKAISNKKSVIDHNFLARYTFGNKQKTGLKLAQYQYGWWISVQ